MATFAPNEEARTFLLQQQKEEDEHLDLLTSYVTRHPRPEVLISSDLKKIDEIMSKAIEKKDYVECVFIQNFIIEGLNITLLRELEHHADGILSELSTKILRDEVRHMEFGITEIERILKEDTSQKLRKKLIWLQRKTLFYSTNLAMTLAGEAKDLGIPMYEFSEKAVGEHFKRIERSGFPLPWIDRIAFNAIMIFLKII